VGTAFPAINVGGMGAAVGPEVGVASGVINTSRQIGAAFGIAVLIAVLTTTSGWYVGSRTDPIEDRAYVWAIPNPIAMGIVGKNLAEFGGVIDRSEHAPAGGFDRWARRQSAGIARDAFGWAFRGAALLLLLALPFARRLTRTPEEVRQAAMAAMAAAQAAAKAAAGGGGAGPPVPAGAVAVAGAADLPPPPVESQVGGARVSVETRIAELEDALRSLRAQVGRAGTDPDGNGDRQPL
jgi:hypothetical protein